MYPRLRYIASLWLACNELIELCVQEKTLYLPNTYQRCLHLCLVMEVRVKSSQTHGSLIRILVQLNKNLTANLRTAPFCYVTHASHDSGVAGEACYVFQFVRISLNL